MKLTRIPLSLVYGRHDNLWTDYTMIKRIVSLSIDQENLIQISQVVEI